jgi:hypothetical protein
MSSLATLFTVLRMSIPLPFFPKYNCNATQREFRKRWYQYHCIEAHAIYAIFYLTVFNITNMAVPDVAV